MNLRVGDRLEFTNPAMGKAHVVEVTKLYEDEGKERVDVVTIYSMGYSESSPNKEYIDCCLDGYAHTNKACYLNLPPVNLENEYTQFITALDKLEKHYET